MESTDPNFVDIYYSGSGLEEEDSFILTCAARSLRDSRNVSIPTSVAIASRVFHAVYFFFVLLAGGFLNILVLVLILRSKNLRNQSFAVAFQITLANLGILAAYLIPTTIQITYGETIFSMNFCVVNGYLVNVFAEVRILLVFLFSLDRFASVFAPFLYPKHNTKVTIINSVIAWLITMTSSLIGIPPILDCYMYRKSDSACVKSLSCSSSCKTFQLTYILAVPVPAMALSLLFFVALYIKGKKIRQKESDIVGIPKNLITNNDWKALKTFFLLALTVIVLNVGVGLFLIVANAKDVIHTPVSLLAIDIFSILSYLAPIVILRNADAKDALRALWKHKSNA